jgi:pyruvate ferredoxin oxidoreductase gamma subunit
MKRITEIRWHGRGGQGAKTVALLFADAALSTGKYIQGFPEYGPERMGAPMMSFNRLSDEPINIHCGVRNPDVVVVLDPTLLKSVNVTEGLPEDGTIIVNTSEDPAQVREKLGLVGRKIFTVDASGISLATLGMNIPNTPMLGAMVKATGLLDFNRMLEDTKSKLAKKFRDRPEVVEGNVNCITRAAREVKSE